MLDEKRRCGFAIRPRDCCQLQFTCRVSVKSRRKISKRSTRVLDHEASNARIFFLAFSNDHRCAFADGLTDKFVPVGFLAPQCHEQGVPLHSPRVIRDVFHRAIKWPDDLANWSRGEESLELHEALTFPNEAFNGAKHWLRRSVPPKQVCGFALPAAFFPLAPRESLCESPHAAQDQDSGQLSPRAGQRSAPRQARRNSTRVWSCAHHRAPPDLQTPDDRRADTRQKKRRTFPLHTRLEGQPSVRFQFFQQW